MKNKKTLKYLQKHLRLVQSWLADNLQYKIRNTNGGYRE